MFEIKGKVALVTGGAQGIGLNIVRELLRNEAKGVALLDTNAEQGKIAVDQLTKEFSDGGVIYINVDVSQKSQFEEAFEETIRTFKQLDIVINNAGIVQELQWEKCIAVNLQGSITGTLLAFHRYLPKYLGNSEGVILNVASVSGLNPEESMPVYSGTKHGIVGFSRSLSSPFNAKNSKVKILVVCPGATDTSLPLPSEDQVTKELRDYMVKGSKMVTFQSPNDLARHVISIIQEGETGSVWKVDLNSRSQVQFPNY